VVAAGHAVLHGQGGDEVFPHGRSLEPRGVVGGEWRPPPVVFPSLLLPPLSNRRQHEPSALQEGVPQQPVMHPFHEPHHQSPGRFRHKSSPPTVLLPPAKSTTHGNAAAGGIE
jgi:hypothetical protein